MAAKPSIQRGTQVDTPHDKALASTNTRISVGGVERALPLKKHC